MENPNLITKDHPSLSPRQKHILTERDVSLCKDIFTRYGFDYALQVALQRKYASTL